MISDVSSTNNYRSWIVPFECDQISLRQGLTSLAQLGAPAEEIPFIVRLLENPDGLGLLPGSVDLHQHDCIHLVLGRGLLPKDEAFIIGFTMGSTKRLSSWNEKLFSWISHHFYPEIYRFSKEDLEVFKDAIHLAQISHCQAFDRIDFDRYLDIPLVDIRKKIGLEVELIQTYYQLEKLRYPHAIESQRLLSTKLYDQPNPVGLKG
ncbi:MAG: hypothetical protein JKY50_08610 [Oleispira sp.]|nr:hypothetical protein [Oleispira sp.]